MNDEYALIHRSPSAVAITARGPYMRKELSSVLNESNFSLPELLHVVHKYKETTKTTRRKKHELK